MPGALVRHRRQGNSQHGRPQRASAWALPAGSGSEVFWLAAVNKLKLDPKDYKIVQVEAPEMVAALERGDIDAYSAWSRG